MYHTREKKRKDSELFLNKKQNQINFIQNDEVTQKSNVGKLVLNCRKAVFKTAVREVLELHRFLSKFNFLNKCLF